MMLDECEVDQFILAISTSSGVAKVALLAKPDQAMQASVKTVFSFEIVDYKSQSAQLLPMIQQHLETAGNPPSKCVAIAVDVGPGGFTSLRTACGIAQGLAVAWNVPTVPLTSFECMLPATGCTQPLKLLIDARLNEVYSATIYRSTQGTVWVEHPCLQAVQALPMLQGPAVCDAHVFGLLQSPPVDIQAGEVSAIQLGILAWQELGAGRVSGPFDCQPLYVRDKVAQTTSERQALKHGAV